MQQCPKNQAALRVGVLRNDPAFRVGRRFILCIRSRSGASIACAYEVITDEEMIEAFHFPATDASPP